MKRYFSEIGAFISTIHSENIFFKKYSWTKMTECVRVRACVTQHTRRHMHMLFSRARGASRSPVAADILIYF
jgi:hypothetical protein